MYTLSQWGVTNTPNVFLAPECVRTHLSGFREDDQQYVLTSPIIEVNGRIITTQSGSTYFLREPNPKYLAYLEEIGYAYDEENPIKDKRL